jgi:hypothetical protein
MFQTLGSLAKANRAFAIREMTSFSVPPSVFDMQLPKYTKLTTHLTTSSPTKKGALDEAQTLIATVLGTMIVRPTFADSLTKLLSFPVYQSVEAQRWQCHRQIPSPPTFCRTASTANSWLPDGTGETFASHPQNIVQHKREQLRKQ